MTRNRTYIEAYASLRFWSEDLNPVAVTKALRLPSDHTHQAGEPQISRSKNGKVLDNGRAPYRHGHWSMSSKRWVESPRVETHIAWVLSEIEPKAGQVRRLIDSGVQGDIFCYSRGKTPQTPSFPNSLKYRAAKLGLEIDIDHYELSQQEEGV